MRPRTDARNIATDTAATLPTSGLTIDATRPAKLLERRQNMAKRANGEGSIFKRKDGRWAASVSLDQGRRKTF